MPESQALAERVQLGMNMTSRLNGLPFDDLDAGRTVLSPPYARGVRRRTVLMDQPAGGPPNTRGGAPYPLG